MSTCSLVGCHVKAIMANSIGVWSFLKRGAGCAVRPLINASRANLSGLGRDMGGGCALGLHEKAAKAMFLISLLSASFSPRVAAITIGPDAGGYVAHDSAPGVSFINISGTGTLLPTASVGDDSSDAFAFGFTFNFYGVPHTGAFASSNGLLSFVAANSDYSNENILTVGLSGDRSTVCVYWDDLYPPVSGDVYVQTLGVAPNRRCIVQWTVMQNIAYGTPGATITFQAQLFEGSNQIVLLYPDVVFGNPTYDNGATATIGIRDVGGHLNGRALQWSFNTPSITSGSVLRFVSGADSVAPIASCQNVTVFLNASGNGSTTAAAVNNGSTDNVGVTGLSLSRTSFTCADVGNPVPVRLTVTDAAGNSATCDATVTVLDNTNPVALCQNVTVILDGSGNGSTTAAAVDNGSNDACGIATLSLNRTGFTCADVGQVPVTLTVTDIHGNSSTCVATVTVEDVTPPVITSTPANIATHNDAGVCGAVVTFPDPTATDACSGGAAGSQTFNFTGAMQSFVVPAGVTEITMVAKGAQGGNAPP